jgi:hypothetical protein
VLASVQGRPVSVIAHMFAATEGYVREVIHAFNDTGFAALDPNAAALARPGSLSEFLQMFFRDDFKIDNRPDGLYISRVRTGILDRLGWRRRQYAAR